MSKVHHLIWTINMMKYRFKSIWYIKSSNSISFIRGDTVFHFSEYYYSLNCDPCAAIEHLSLRYANTDFIHKITEFIVRGDRSKTTLIHTMEKSIYYE